MHCRSVILAALSVIAFQSLICSGMS